MFPLVLLTVALGMAEAGKVYYQASQDSDASICPDQVSRCSGTSSCCQMDNGQWGCCKFAKATCCSDNVHCCPQGYSCDVSKKTCVQAYHNDTIPMVRKEPAATPPPPDNTVCPDRSFCVGSLSSCCRTYAGNYRCCSYPRNVCCSDGYHCCPRGYICDLYSFTCRRGSPTSDDKDMVPMLSMTTGHSMAWSSIEDSN